MSRHSPPNSGLASFLGRLPLRRGAIFGLLIIMALLAFEVFNYSTTEFALGDLLGDLRFAGVPWATILAIAFCGIDFAGIARMFTPEQGADEPAEVWYLFGAWLLGATMNAILTWWGVSIAILHHDTLGNAVVEKATLLRVVPVFVAIMVWLIRILIIGTFSVAGERLFSETSVQPRQRLPEAAHQPQPQTQYTAPRSLAVNRSAAPQARPAATPLMNTPFKPVPKTPPPPEPEHPYTRPEPSYHPVGMQSGSRNNAPRQ